MNSPATTGGASLLMRPRLAVLPEWIDLYGHMNAARYFDLFIDEGYALFDDVGLGRRYTEDTRHGIFSVEARISYLSELTAGAAIQVRMRILDIDRVRILALLELHDLDRNIVAATLEQLSVHVSLVTRGAVAFPEPLAARIHALALKQQAIPLPAKHRRVLQCQPAKGAGPLHSRQGS